MALDTLRASHGCQGETAATGGQQFSTFATLHGEFGQRAKTIDACAGSAYPCFCSDVVSDGRYAGWSESIATERPSVAPANSGIARSPSGGSA
jgi:hypothetical protein